MGRLNAGAAMQPPWACRLQLLGPVCWQRGLAGWIARCRCCGRWAAPAGVAWPARCCAPVCLAGLIPAPVRIVLGVLALWLAWLAVVQARILGINFLLSVLTLVWVADIFAYFAGRAFGLRFTRNKLAPPSALAKAGRGVWGGLAGCCAWPWPGLRLTVISRRTSPVLYPPVFRWLVVPGHCRGVHGGHERGGRSGRIADQAQRGVKDSSGLLPGHGAC